MRAKSLLLLMLALGCGLVASIGITQVMNGSGDGPDSGQTEAIFVAIEDIPPGDLITAEAIKLEEWPVDKIPEGTITRLEDVEGQRPRSRIYADSPILSQQLGGLSGATTNIPKGYRVVPVKVDSVTGGGNMIRPGDRVDVTIYLSRNPSRNIPYTRTKVILEDIKVFAVNDSYEMDPDGSGQKMRASTISLLVTPAQAQKVILATELGKVRLVMRSPEDSGESEALEATMDELLGLSEKSERDQDSPSPIGPPQSGEQSDDFLKFLAGQQSSGADNPPPSDQNTWRMRKIAGDEVTEVVLALESDSPKPQGVGANGFSLWKLMAQVAQPGGSESTEVTEETEPGDEEDEQEPADEPERVDAPEPPVEY